jgi:hypothetical protein
VSDAGAEMVLRSSLGIVAVRNVGGPAIFFEELVDPSDWRRALTNLSRVAFFATAVPIKGAEASRCSSMGHATGVSRTRYTATASKDAQNVAAHRLRP